MRLSSSFVKAIWRLCQGWPTALSRQANNFVKAGWRLYQGWSTALSRLANSFVKAGWWLFVRSPFGWASSQCHVWIKLSKIYLFCWGKKKKQSKRMCAKKCERSLFDSFVFNNPNFAQTKEKFELACAPASLAFRNSGLDSLSL